MAVEICEMTGNHWNDVSDIYAQGIATGIATFEAEPPDWEQWDKSHLAFGRFVARDEGEIVAWGALSPVSGRYCYRGVAEVSIYVRDGLRGRGIGRLLMEAIIQDSEQNGIWTLQGGTFRHNQASLKLQQACGFRVIGHRERIGQLNGRWMDTVLTERRSVVVGVSDDLPH